MYRKWEGREKRGGEARASSKCTSTPEQKQNKKEKERGRGKGASSPMPQVNGDRIGRGKNTSCVCVFCAFAAPLSRTVHLLTAGKKKARSKTHEAIVIQAIVTPFFVFLRKKLFPIGIQQQEARGTKQ